MKKSGAVKFLAVVLLLLPLMAVAHYIIFPRETRCILLPFSGLSPTGNIYSKKNTAVETIARIRELATAAEQKNKAFWKQDFIANYKIIYCNSEDDFNKYGVTGAPASTNLKLGAFIVVKDEGLDSNIIAHEVCHTILYRNLGWYKRTFTIPVWFDEGLAMQVDDRALYSTDTLLMRQRNGLKLPLVTGMTKAADFFSGDPDAIILNFATAKYVVHEWCGTHSLGDFIDAITSGKTFKEAYAAP